MSPKPEGEIARLLRAWGGGDQSALGRLAPLVYGELHRLAGIYMRGEIPESRCSRRTGARSLPAPRGRGGYRVAGPGALLRGFGADHAAILVDAAPARGEEKRGAGVVKMDVNASIDGIADNSQELIALDGALDALAQFDARKARVIELRFFRRVERGRDGGGAEDLTAECEAGLEGGAGVADGGNGRRRGEGRAD